MATVSKLNFFGGFGDVIEETPSPIEAMILSSYFDDKIQRDEQYLFLLDNSTFGFMEHQVPEEIWQAFPRWRLKYKNFDVWSRSGLSDKTIMIIAVEGRGTREARMTVLARFIPQPGDMEKPRIQQSVTTLGEMKAKLIIDINHGTTPFERWVGMVLIDGFEIKLLNYLATITIFPLLILMVIDALVGNQTYEEKWRGERISRAINLHSAELAEAKARVETS